MKKKFFTEALHKFLRTVIRNPKYRWWAIAAALLYFVSPLDIAPDAFPIIGWIDDGAIMTLLVAEATQMLMEYSKNRKNQTVAQAPSQPTTGASNAQTEVVDTIDVKAVSIS